MRWIRFGLPASIVAVVLPQLTMASAIINALDDASGYSEGGQTFGSMSRLGTLSAYDITINILNWLVAISAVLMLAVAIYAGARWMMSGGNTDVVEKAQGTLRGVAVGLLLVLMSYMLIGFSVTVFGEITGPGTPVEGQASPNLFQTFLDGFGAGGCAGDNCASTPSE